MQQTEKRNGIKAMNRQQTAVVDICRGEAETATALRSREEYSFPADSILRSLSRGTKMLQVSRINELTASGHRLTEESVSGFPLARAHASLDHAHRGFVRRFTF